MKKIGIVGFGIVGSAVKNGFKNVGEFRIYDINPDIYTDSFEEAVKYSDYVFICVPTPTDIKTGKCDTTILEETMRKASQYATPNKLFIIKSTIAPGTTNKIREEYKNMRIVFNPEFLRENSYLSDFVNTDRIILGGNESDCIRVRDLYRLIFPNTPIYMTDCITAETVKYISNCFLATKVALCNEFFDICEGLGISYKEVMDMVLADKRIGKSHTDVPGHDGDRGFGGLCFPKDINALIHKAEEIGIDPMVMKSAWKKNLEVRKNKDWLEREGAFSEDSG